MVIRHMTLGGGGKVRPPTRLFTFEKLKFASKFYVGIHIRIVLE